MNQPDKTSAAASAALPTPRPWILSITKRGDPRVSSKLEEFAIATIPNGWMMDNVVSPRTRRANADFIIRACNGHDELVAVLKELLNSYELVEGDPSKVETALFDKVRRVLKDHAS